MQTCPRSSQQMPCTSWTVLRRHIAFSSPWSTHLLAHPSLSDLLCFSCTGAFCMMPTRCLLDPVLIDFNAFKNCLENHVMIVSVDLQLLKKLIHCGDTSCLSSLLSVAALKDRALLEKHCHNASKRILHSQQEESAIREAVAYLSIAIMASGKYEMSVQQSSQKKLLAAV